MLVPVVLHRSHLETTGSFWKHPPKQASVHPFFTFDLPLPSTSTGYLNHPGGRRPPTSEELLDFPTSCGGCELVDDVQGRLVVRVAYIHIDARLEKQSKAVSRLSQRLHAGHQLHSHRAATAPPPSCRRARPRADRCRLWSLCSNLSQLPTTTWTITGPGEAQLRSR